MAEAVGQARARLPGQERPLVALDAACGHGRLHDLLGLAGDEVRSLGVDTSPGRLASFAHEEAQRSVRPPLLIQAEVRPGRIPLADQSVDLTLCFRLLHHLRTAPDRQAALEELARVTRGLLLLSYYARGSLHTVQRELLHRIGRRKASLGHVSGRVLVGELGELGFVPVSDRGVLSGIHAQRVALFQRQANPGPSERREVRETSGS